MTTSWTASENHLGFLVDHFHSLREHYTETSIPEASCSVPSNWAQPQLELKARIAFSGLMLWTDVRTGLNTERSVKSPFQERVREEGREGKKEMEWHQKATKRNSCFPCVRTHMFICRRTPAGHTRCQLSKKGKVFRSLYIKYIGLNAHTHWTSPCYLDPTWVTIQSCKTTRQWQDSTALPS